MSNHSTFLHPEELEVQPPSEAVLNTLVAPPAELGLPPHLHKALSTDSKRYTRATFHELQVQLKDHFSNYDHVRRLGFSSR
jgi:hypothetical protein